MNVKTQNIVAVIIGMLVIIAVGAMLIPLIRIVLANVFTFSNGKSFNSISINILLFLFTAIPSFIGGFVTCWIAVTRKIFAALMMGLLSFLIIIILGSAVNIFSIGSTLTVVTIVPLALMGGIVRRIIENKKEDKMYKIWCILIWQIPMFMC